MAAKQVPYESGRLKYPLENQDEYNTKVSIQAVRVNNIKSIANLISSSETAADNLSPPNEGTEEAQQQRNQLRGKKLNDAVTQTNFKRMNTEFVEGGKAEIYLPASLVFSDRLGYSTPDIGVIGGGVAAGFQNAESIANIGASALQSELSAYGDLFNLFTSGNLNAFGIAAGKAAAAKIISKNPFGQGDAASIGLRVTIAPNTRARFQNVAIRRFTFDFKFIPKSRAEAESVENLIKFFRFHSHPNSISEGAGNIPIAYDYPDMFKIKVLYNKATNGGRQFRPIGQQIKLCYLEGINVVYNPTSQVFHSDGSPVETNITLNFLEYRTLNRSDVSENINDLDPDLIAAATNIQGS